MRKRLLVASFTSLFAIVALRSAWMHDDAYITFRTVDNFINGYGLRWNTAERVQAYTHPLWMFLVSAFYAVTHEAFYTVICLSIGLSAATVLVIGFGIASSTSTGVLGILVLTLSKAFVDYSTSGLENPLTHFLYASFLVAFLRSEQNLASLYLLSSIAALCAFNRMDTLLLCLPVLLFVLAKAGRLSGVAVAAAGFLPLIVWEAFSLFYYGFPFPNTAYAKLFSTGVGAASLARHGGYYLTNSARLDPLTLSAIAGGIAVGLASRETRSLPVIGGILAYLLYVVSIGGDFVTGRFLAAPLLGAVVLLSRWHSASTRLVLATSALVLVVGFASADPPPLSTAAYGSTGKPQMDANGIADERAYYYPYTGLLRTFHGVKPSDHPWAVEGARARKEGGPLDIRGDIGLFGYYAGPAVHVLDLWGLGDPLLARLPARQDIRWRVGHFQRAVPDGYVETLASGQNRIADRSLARYYDKLAIVTRGRLFDPDRWVEIWKLNTGRYDLLIHGDVSE